jgi:hypothetical protein
MRLLFFLQSHVAIKLVDCYDHPIDSTTSVVFLAAAMKCSMAPFHICNPLKSYHIHVLLLTVSINGSVIFPWTILFRKDDGL